MRAQELIGKYVVRTRPVILAQSKGNNVMDDSFMDAKNPVMITSYNDLSNSFVVENISTGYVAILDGDYNDDNWADAEDKPHIYKPYGFHSIDEVYAKYEKQKAEHEKDKKERAGKRPDVHTGLGIMECINVLDDFIDKHGDVVFQYDYPFYNGMQSDIARINDVGDSYVIKECEGNPDIIFNKCDDGFAKAVTLLLKHSVNVISTLNAIYLASMSGFGYSAINNYNGKGPLFIVAASGTYTATFDDLDINISRSTPLDMLKMLYTESEADIVMLNSKESSDIYNKVSTKSDSSGTYKTAMLDLG